MASIKRDIPIGNKQYTVHVSGTIAKGKPVVLRGYARDKMGLKLPGTFKTVTAKNEHEIERTISRLVSNVSQTLPKSSKLQRRPENNIPSSLMEETLNYIEDKGLRISELWNAHTQHMFIVYFRRNVLPYLILHGNEWTEANKDDLISQLISGIMKKKHSSKNYSTAKRTVGHYLSAAFRIYEKMRIIEPLLPEIDLYPYFGRIAQKEQLKCLPEAVRKKLTTWIESLVDTRPGIAAAAALMFGCGLRTAEAAAVLPEQIIISDTSSSVWVGFQVRENKRINVLKTPNSYRTVSLTAWTENILFRCFETLSFSDNERNFLCAPNELSSILRTALIQCGLTTEFLLAAEAAMDRAIATGEEEYEELLGVSAYVLRRDWTTRARNYCAFTTDEIDHFLGHKREQIKKDSYDYRNDEAQQQLAQKLENYIVNPEISRHPALSPIQIESCGNIELPQFTIVRLRNNTQDVLNIELNITAMLSAEPITIIAQHPSANFQKFSRFTKGKLETASIIGDQKLLFIKEDGSVSCKE